MKNDEKHVRLGGSKKTRQKWLYSDYDAQRLHFTQYFSVCNDVACIWTETVAITVWSVIMTQPPRVGALSDDACLTWCPSHV